MHRRRGLVAVVLAAALGLAGCASLPSAVIQDSVLTVGLDVPYTGAGPASPGSTTADLAVAAATLAGFSFTDAEGARVDDTGFGTMTVVSDSPFTVRYTVADGIEWSDGVGIDGVDLLLDWAARAHPFAGARFGAEPDPALAGVRDVVLSDDRKSLTVEFAAASVPWEDAFRAPLPAHEIAARAFDSATPEIAKDDVIAAVDAARGGDVAALAELGAAWSSAFDPAGEALPASGPYRLVDAGPDLVELEANAGYEGMRSPTYSHLELRSLDDRAAIVQALSIREFDLVQFAWDEALRTVLTRVGADRATLPDEEEPAELVGWFHREVDGVQPGHERLGALWNPWAWAPYSLADL